MSGAKVRGNGTYIHDSPSFPTKERSQIRRNVGTPHIYGGFQGGEDRNGRSLPIIAGRGATSGGVYPPTRAPNPKTFPRRGEGGAENLWLFDLVDHAAAALVRPQVSTPFPGGNHG
jgi:hypothetical protein